MNSHVVHNDYVPIWCIGNQFTRSGSESFEVVHHGFQLIVLHILWTFNKSWSVSHISFTNLHNLMCSKRGWWNTKHHFRESDLICMELVDAIPSERFLSCFLLTHDIGNIISNNLSYKNMRAFFHWPTYIFTFFSFKQKSLHYNFPMIILFNN